MAGEIVVKGASVSLRPSNPVATIITTTHTLSISTTGPFLTSASNEILLEADVDASFASYTTQYNATPAHSIPGTLMYQSLKSITQLSEFTNKNSEPIVIKSTEGAITCAVIPGTESKIPGSPPTPDINSSYDIDFSFSDAVQTLSKSD